MFVATLQKSNPGNKKNILPFDYVEKEEIPIKTEFKKREDESVV